MVKNNSVNSIIIISIKKNKILKDRKKYIRLLLNTLKILIKILEVKNIDAILTQIIFLQIIQIHTIKYLNLNKRNNVNKLLLEGSYATGAVLNQYTATLLTPG